LYPFDCHYWYWRRFLHSKEEEGSSQRSNEERERLRKAKVKASQRAREERPVVEEGE
jgi:hypothetical protein